MFAYIKGLLTLIQPTCVVVETQGIGYTLFIPSRLLGLLPPLGQSVQFYTTFVVREYAHTLYGFLDSRERDVFEILMSVTGIGPKLALSLIGSLSLPGLRTAILQKDLLTLCQVPGVGKKTAERLVVELKDKLADLLVFPEHLSLSSTKSPPQHFHDAVSALVNLGYQRQAAQRAVKQALDELPATHDLSLLITQTLKHI